MEHNELRKLTAEIVSAYVRNNAIPPSDLPELIRTVAGALSAPEQGQNVAPTAEQKPAVPIKQSLKRDKLLCLECGREQKTLKRHVSTAHGLSPEEYREKWGLKPDYPMVAPDYAKARSAMAKQIGLGTKRVKKT